MELFNAVTRETAELGGWSDRIGVIPTPTRPLVGTRCYHIYYCMDWRLVNVILIILLWMESYHRLYQVGNDGDKDRGVSC